ncbi:MAG TPA: glycosyltransferase family 1 protein [Acidimicrobiales bacterium]
MSSLRLGFDATPLLGARTGVGVMTARVLEQLTLRDDVSVVAYAATWRGRGRLPSLVPAGVTCVTRPMPARPLHFAWRHSDLPPIEWFTGPLDVVHGPNFVVPPARAAARVVTVHDLTAVHHPELCTAHTRTYPDALRRALARGAWVHTVSDFVRDEILETFDVDPARVVTVPNGVDAIAAAEPGAGVALAGGAPYVLALGTVEPRKNYPALLRAFDAVADKMPGVRLVIAGPDGWDSARFEETLAACRHRDRVTRIGMVDEDRRAALLRDAHALVYPSLYEGFGLPPLEAMSVGVPVLATDIGAVREVAADAALLVPTGDDTALAEALVRIVEDDALRTDLAHRGRLRAASYDWSKTAAGLVALYERAHVGS